MVNKDLIKTENLIMNYFSFGKGERNLFVIPGLSVKNVSESAEAVREQYKLYENDFTVYVVDRRENVFDGISISDFARDVIYLADFLKIERFSVLGVSQGAMIGSFIASQYPERVEKLGIASCGLSATEHFNGLMHRWADLAQKHEGLALFKDFVTYVYSPAVAENFIRTAENVCFSDDELDRFAVIANAAPNYHLPEKFLCPVSVWVSKNDNVTQFSAAQRLVEALNCPHFFCENYSHAIYDEDPDFVKRSFEFFK